MISDQTFDSIEFTNTLDDAVTLAHEDRIIYGVRSVNDPTVPNPLPRQSEQYETPYKNVALLRYVWLPQEHEALALFDEYIRSTATVYHILHHPTTRKMIRGIYTSLMNREPLNTSHIALLLSILATGAYFWTPAASAHPYLFASPADATDKSLVFLKWTLDVLDNNHRTTNAAIEDCQANVLISHCIVNYEGFSARAHTRYNASLNQARTLSLHLTDSPRHRRKLAQPYSRIQIELRRRLWWYIAVTDW